MIESLRRSRKPSSEQFQTAGFTLTEGLIVAVIIGLLVAIAAPSFFGFWQQRQINIARDMVYQALRVTQADAMQQRSDRRFSIRERNGRIEWANHLEAVPATQVTTWQPLIDGVVLADIDNTLTKAGGIHYTRFDMYGNLKSKAIGEQGTITLTISGKRDTNRCVVVSTVLGALRKGQGQARANDNERFCY
ncbi:pilus assembly FimT family protein [Nodosilinea sp. AN01ver1]|uniref:pilus assembly FimT family protein n=1 Tax=Nodosilinea sp. AN01ver1 TaxID=3423362 RepID=UPI003D30FA7F